MLDLTSVRMRYYPVKFCGRVLELEPPKMKTLNRLVAVSNQVAKGDMGPFEEYVPLISKMLSKNRSGVRVSPEEVEEALTFDQAMELLREYVYWLSKEKQDPN